MIDIERFREYCLSFDGVTEKTPFGKFASRYQSILVFYVLNHMFCFIDIDDFSWCDVRSTPEKVESLRMRFTAIEAPLNQDARYWMKINFNQDIPDKEILALIAQSYAVVKEKYTPKKPLSPQ